MTICRVKREEGGQGRADEAMQGGGVGDKKGDGEVEGGGDLWNADG